MFPGGVLVGEEKIVPRSVTTLALSFDHRLVDGEFRSGEALASELGVSRAAVWKLVRAWQARGLDIHAVRGRGYRLARPLELGLEQAMEFCAEDECVEVTPEIVRVRKVELDATSRARAKARAKARG